MNSRSPSLATIGTLSYRLTSLVRLPAPVGRGVLNRATLYHDACSLEVSWHSATVDCRLKRGCLVSFRGLPGTARLDAQACLSVGRVDLIDKPLPRSTPS